MVDAVFLDRDGTLIKPQIINSKSIAIDTIDKLEYYEDIFSGFNLLRKKFRTFMITNQPDVLINGYSRQEVTKINKKVCSDLSIDDYECCFGTKTSDPYNYKPGPGMLISLSKKHKIDLSKTYLIGDRDIDMMAAHNAGSRGIMIDRNMNENKKNALFITKNFLEACRYITKQ